jgi:hypothetical protein
MVDSTSLHPQVKKLCLSSLVCKEARIPLFIFWTFELEAETEGNVLVTQCYAGVFLVAFLCQIKRVQIQNELRSSEEPDEGLHAGGKIRNVCQQ